MKLIDKMVSDEILLNQTLLVEECFKKEVFSMDDLVNEYEQTEREDGESEEPGDMELKEVFSWYLITEWLADKLDEKGETLLRNDFGTWWGRGCFGQMISMDSVIKDVYKENTIS